MKLKSIWSTITGGATSAAPVLLSCCKSGACVGVCASPVASLFGVSSATFASSPWVMALEPVLIALSAISFTVSYYSLYKIPKLAACNTPGSCDCPPDPKAARSIKIQKWIFWLGLILSIGFLTYFEVSKYQAANAPVECGTEGCTPDSAECTSGEEESCTTACDTTSGSACCAGGEEEAIAATGSSALVCKLTSKELRERKETIIASLKKQILEKKELSNGYAFKFAGTDNVIDELSEFVKSERSCCNFFTFGLSYSGDGKEAWLNLTGPEGTKDFIRTELGFIE